MKTTKKVLKNQISIVSILALLIVPAVAQASWWNPFTWVIRWPHSKPTVVSTTIKTNPSELSNTQQKPEEKKSQPELPEKVSIESKTQNTSSNSASVPAPTQTSQKLHVAQCLKAKGAKFYGAYWCPHCQKQKALFGSAASELPYVECAFQGEAQKKIDAEIAQAVQEGKLTSGDTPESIGIKTRPQVCIENGIDGYPTWIFSDGTRISGEQSIESLAEKAGC